MPPERSLGEILERIAASEEHDADTPGILGVVRDMTAAGGEDQDVQPGSAERRETFTKYSAVLAAREQWAISELVRRGLLPPPD